MEEDVSEEDLDIEFYDFPSFGGELFDIDQIKGVRLCYQSEELDTWAVLKRFKLQDPDLLGPIYYWDEEMNEFADSEEEAREIFKYRSQNSIENYAFLTIDYPRL